MSSWSSRKARLAIAATCAIGALTGSAVSAGPAAAGDGTGAPKVSVLTRNLYLGADLTPAITAPTLPDFLAATAEIWRHVQETNFDERAATLAREIDQTEPDLIGLQEAAIWRTGAIGDPAPAVTVVYDFLAQLQAELDARGAHYDVVVSQNEADLEAPVGAPYLIDARLTQRDVILVREGAKLALSNAQSAHFATNLSIPIPAAGTTFVSLRGWTSVDVRTKHGQAFRFINTHLEAFHPLVRLAQAQELLAGPIGAAPDSVVLAGDINSGPELPEPVNRLAYFALVAGGMVDTWPILHPGDPGFTSSLGDDLNDPADALEHRVDMVMFKGDVTPAKSYRTGNDPKNRTASGLWPSDHLGYLAVLRIG
ncbi:MAG TPA: endonuclease/exonuclease/phosphatase family protein [Actinomycetes bacterium]|nr:endonuclease/exonuclease/phosphatase family protein [Actinomycetes bacterium]